MEDLFKNAQVLSENESEKEESEETEQEKKPKTNRIKEWFNNHKIAIIIFTILVISLVIVSVILYFKSSSVGTMISCKEEIIDGLNRELTKQKLQISKLEIKNEELEKSLEKQTKELQKKTINELTKKEKESIKKKMNAKPEKPKVEEIDSLVFNAENAQQEEELDELPVNV